MPWRELSIKLKPKPLGAPERIRDGGKMKTGFCIVAAATMFASIGLPAWSQDATLINVRFCGAGFQGSADTFKRNPNLNALIGDTKFRKGLYPKLLAQSQSSAWGVNLYDVTDEAARGATMGLSHVFTYESVDRQKFRDPRDGIDYYNSTYSIGVNTVLFDLTERQIRTIIPTIVVAANVTTKEPTPAEDLAQFRAILEGFEQPDSAVSRWLKSITDLPIRYDERSYFQVKPVELSPEARATLTEAAKAKGQTPATFVRNATTQLEAMMAVAFRKPVVPISLNAEGEVAEGSQYLASMPECLGQTAPLILPPPSFQLRIAVDKLLETSFQHRLPDDGGSAFQSELGYGGRYQAELAKYDSLNGSTVLDTRTFRYQKSIRFSGERDISSYEQYFKLTSSFMRSVLEAYVSQDKNWIKANMSAAVTDKKQRDPGGVIKAWKLIIRDQMKISPPPRVKEDEDV